MAACVDESAVARLGADRLGELRIVGASEDKNSIRSARFNKLNPRFNGPCFGLPNRGGSNANVFGFCSLVKERARSG